MHNKKKHPFKQNITFFQAMQEK